MYENGILLEDFHHKNLDFKLLLNNKNFIIWKGCSNLRIKISSPISRLEFLNCNNIFLECDKIYGGLILKKTTMELLPNDTIWNLDLEKSNITIISNQHFISNTILD